MSKILIVEDDLSLAKMIEEWLQSQYHLVDLVSNGNDALEKLRFYDYDAIILDWNLPGCNGVDVCREYRRNGGKTPIIMLTGKDNIQEKERGFEVGADDYLTKPFDFRELIARLRALLRRPVTYAGGDNNIVTRRDVSINTINHVVTKGTASIHLPPKEYALLEFLMKHPDEVFNAETLLNRVWPSESDMSSESVRIYVTRLRTKIDSKDQPSLIKTVYGFGYKLVSTDESGVEEGNGESSDDNKRDRKQKDKSN